MEGVDTVGDVLRVMRSSSFASYLERCTGLKLMRTKDGQRTAMCQVRAFKQGCYQRARPVVDHEHHASRAAVGRNVRGVLEVVFCSADLGRIPGWRNGMYARQDLHFLGGGGRRGQGTVGAEAVAGSGGGEEGGSTGVESGERVGFHYLGWVQGAGGELVYVSRSRGGWRDVGGGREVAGEEQEGDGQDYNGPESGFRGQVVDVGGAARLEWEGREGLNVKNEAWEEEEELCALMCHGNSLSLVLAQGT